MADILKKEMLLEKWDYMIFSQDNSPYWNNDSDMNYEYLKCMENYLRSRVTVRGYALVTDLLIHMGMKIKPNQFLAGWSSEKVDSVSSLFEVYQRKDGSGILIHFINCDEFLVDDIYKGRVKI